MLAVLIVVMVSWVDTSIKVHQIVHLKYVQEPYHIPLLAPVHSAPIRRSSPRPSTCLVMPGARGPLSSPSSLVASALAGCPASSAWLTVVIHL